MRRPHPRRAASRSEREGDRARLRRLFPGAGQAAPPPAVERTIDGIVDLLDGKNVDLTGVDLDMAGVAPFRRKVHEVVRNIPPRIDPHLRAGRGARRRTRLGTRRQAGDGEKPLRSRRTVPSGVITSSAVGRRVVVR